MSYTIDLASSHLRMLFGKTQFEENYKYSHNIFSVIVQDYKKHFFNWKVGFYKLQKSDTIKYCAIIT